MAMTAVLLVMAVQARVANATDHIDGREPNA
jgi:multisubunit Na+/H+ antiporter MnhC subunit